MKSILATYIILLGLVLLPQSSFPAIITVGGGCTLTGAIGNANYDGDGTYGKCAAGSGADEIRLTGDVVLTAIDNTTTGDNGLPSIASTITIQGAGYEISRHASAPYFRILDVAPTGNLTLVETTLSGGLSEGAGVAGDSFGGGGILNRSGSVTLINSTVSGNTVSGNSDPMLPSLGGGIMNHFGTVTLIGSTLSGNQVHYNEQSDGLAYGGGIFNEGGVVMMTNSTVIGNSCLTYSDCFDGPCTSICRGGGIHNHWWGAITLNNSNVTENNLNAAADGSSSSQGGGIFNAGTLNLHNSTVSGNSLSATAGIPESVTEGGGIHNIGTLNLYNSTVSDNSALGSIGQGGGISGVGTVFLQNATISGNSATMDGAAISADATLYGTLIANSTGSTHCSGVITDGGGNKADDASCGTVPADLTGLDSTLADNGGPTLTHALLEGSNAINAAGNCGLDTDQRGSLRFDGACDSGAVEFGPVLSPDNIFTDGFETQSPCTIDGVWVVEARDCVAEDCSGNNGRYMSWDGKYWCRALITQEWEDWVIEVPPAVTIFDFWVDWGAWDMNDCGDGLSAISISACGLNEPVLRDAMEKHLTCDVTGLSSLTIVKEKDSCEYIIIGNPYFY
jgi:hypothetical protein